ncbi:hypothetical protein [Macrococcus carouselicus]|uniref:Uncharacterized protein n=1 Tax=Macrococcus carouselicus TaxID=69969 RepID=A0A9Q8FNZ9_9STAP|nr:hypothetical protein [Macrococcus carouselicus]TDL95516.1 hypothetical protein ERX40_10055 [Macrococcus carouselicus]
MVNLSEYRENEIISRLNLTILILLAAVLLLGIVTYNKSSYQHSLSDELTTKEKKRKEVTQENEKIKQEQKKIDDSVGTQDVIAASEFFNDKYFVWSTWKMYSQNMNDLKTRYPNLESNKYVDISGMSVGTGNSPNSDYSVETYTTINNNEIAEIINQNRQYDDKVTKRLLYKVSTFEEGKYDIETLKAYSEAL